MEVHITHIYTPPSPSPSTPLIMYAGYLQPLYSKSQLSVAGGVASLCETSSPFNANLYIQYYVLLTGEAEQH